MLPAKIQRAPSSFLHHNSKMRKSLKTYCQEISHIYQTDNTTKPKSPPIVPPRTPKNLAKRMAELAQIIRQVILTALTDDHQDGILQQQFQLTQKILNRELTTDEFADMSAQTICYVTFVKCLNQNQPPNLPFFPSIFSQIAGPELDERITWAVDTLANILQQTDMAEILKEFGQRTHKTDPVVHFYETFLAEYDPKMREARGVYYTPEPVVDYLVKSVDYILKQKFHIPQGLADSTKIHIPHPHGTIHTHKVLILDPAVGTGTFIHAIIDYISEQFQTKKGMWSSYVSQHLLPRLFGFELLMAPYTVAHMKLGLQLQELGYDFSSDERLRIYLTNTLQEAFQLPEQVINFGSRIKEEAEAAKEVKQEHPVMVIIGNPPYSGHSVNTGDWITNLLKGRDIIGNTATANYFAVDGQPLGEKNPKWLNDDYVKFIRFSQWRIDQTGYGVLAFITNHGYLDNPTFRGMRQSLMQSFDEIYVLDLHGNSKKQEISPDGSPDQNVFDIQQGVAIGIFIKYRDSQGELAKVYHGELWGVREIYEQSQLVGGKYHWLAEHDISSTPWTELTPNSPFYLFQPQDVAVRAEYEAAAKISEIMPMNTVGIVTARDALTIQWTADQVWEVVNDFASLSPEEARQKYDLGKDTRDWKVELAQKDLRNHPLDHTPDKTGPFQELQIPILYRPFDVRYTYYTAQSRGFHCMPRYEVMKHLIAGDNLGLIATRQVTSLKFCHINVSRIIIELKVGSHDRSTQILPLYLYPTDKPTLFDHQPTNAPGGRRPNLAPEFIAEFSGKLGLDFITDGKGDKSRTFGPEDIFHYIYAIFHSPTYRHRYAEFLKIDFPRVPLTSNVALFWSLVAAGDKLVQLHLMQTTGQEIATYPIPGSDVVEKVKYNEQFQQVWINSEQYFAPVTPDIWNFHIGGYQVCEKWLKDRKGRVLSFDDLSHYQNILSILGSTIEMMGEVDGIIEKFGGFPLG
ncbi:MAG TPA: N-6 DNA methylase [Oscillatoriaceae cyanobacterium M33_DOE_052]|uniref:site-specific DNA-methyltransferase (adenine-specific) n=1 Tax=Planktothricoides sp. SpSt-374 TaxID=2282167 RepID=A0A7C3VQV2_9CYAN|nr:N-6 DNA methylase [Oscillatoriaceae cyanobacterium M33_DOE_052]